MKKVLIVEENPRMSAFHAEEFACEGYRLLFAGDGADALRMVASHRPDVVVMDLVLPDMDGLEALTRMLSLRSDLPVIIRTDCPTCQDSFMDVSADAYLCKTGQLVELKKLINEVLEPTVALDRACQPGPCRPGCH